MVAIKVFIHVLIFGLLFQTSHGGKIDTGEIETDNERPVIRINTQGFIRGKKSSDGPYYEFMGIPYATATQSNRFMNPLPVPTWKGIREADKDNVVCPQFDDNGTLSSTQNATYNEDCLTLNLFTPSNGSSHSKMAVMVYIHGGRFNVETCCGKYFYERYGPKLFMENGVILIHFHYRLGLLGFLCNENTANNGIKDAIAVLKWVRDNIESFGGDPQKVTIFGQSSGGPMVELLMLSKQSQGLISGAISQSGSVLFPGCIADNPGEIAYEVAKQFGYEGRDHQEMMKTLRQVPVNDLTKSFLQLPQNYSKVIPITPCIEPESNVDAIITSDPLNIMQSGKYNDVPFMTGFVKNEGMTLYEAVNMDPGFLDTLESKFFSTLPKELQFSSAEQTQRIVDLVNEFYFEGKNVSAAPKSKIVDYIGDVTFAYPIIKGVRGLMRSNRTAPLYLYEFAYDGGMPFLKLYLNITHIPGVCHADDLGYLFTQHGVSPIKADDEITARRIVKLWTNFSKFGDPTPQKTELLPVKWETAEDMKYLLIDRTLKMEQYPLKERIQFWDNIYKNYTRNFI